MPVYVMVRVSNKLSSRLEMNLY